MVYWRMSRNFALRPANALVSRPLLFSARGFGKTSLGILGRERPGFQAMATHTRAAIALEGLILEKIAPTGGDGFF